MRFPWVLSGWRESKMEDPRYFLLLVCRKRNQEDSRSRRPGLSKLKRWVWIFWFLLKTFLKGVKESFDIEIEDRKEPCHHMKIWNGIGLSKRSPWMRWEWLWAKGSHFCNSSSFWVQRGIILAILFEVSGLLFYGISTTRFYLPFGFLDQQKV